MQPDTQRRALLVALLAAASGTGHAAARRPGANIVFLSGEAQPLLLDESDRRFVVISPAAMETSHAT